jgi:hypothetical protein
MRFFSQQPLPHPQQTSTFAGESCGRRPAWLIREPPLQTVAETGEGYMTGSHAWPPQFRHKEAAYSKPPTQHLPRLQLRATAVLALGSHAVERFSQIKKPHELRRGGLDDEKSALLPCALIFLRARHCDRPPHFACFFKLSLSTPWTPTAPFLSSLAATKVVSVQYTQIGRAKGRKHTAFCNPSHRHETTNQMLELTCESCGRVGVV